MAKEKTRGNTNTGTMNTIVGKGSVMEGVFRIDNSIRIDGTLKGDLSSSNAVIVGPTGQVEVNVLKAKSVIIGGKVIGTLDVSERTHLQARSVLLGDLKTKLLIVEEGAVFRGNCDSGGEIQTSGEEAPAIDVVSAE